MERKKHLVQATLSQERSQQLACEELKDRIQEERSNILTRLEETARQVEISRSALAIAQENLILNTFSYNEGKLPILDVLSAQVVWLQAYTNVVSSNYLHKITYAEYIRITGRIK